ncbi:MAG: GNAT family N-acetyltransferase [Rhodospirillales bacterium]|nr:GNAT family N-acetyltransferase [Rhodospirillales bacterium]
MTVQASPHITLRPYQAGDEQAIGELITTIQRDEFNVPLSLDDQPDLADIAGFYGHGTGGFWVAICADQIVGTIALLDITNQQTALRKMFVAKAYRGSAIGVAKRLLENLISECRQKNVTEIFLGTTADFLAAHRFYEKNGFKQFSKTDLPPRFPIMAVDSRFYRLEL